MISATQRHRVILLLLVAAIENARSSSTKRLRRNLGTRIVAKSTKSLSMKLNSAVEHNPWGAQLDEFLWVDDEGNESMSTPLSFSNTVMQPEFEWHQLEDDLSISMPDDLSVPVLKEDTFNWDIFETEEPDNESESPVTVTNNEETAEEESLPITVEPEPTPNPSSSPVQTSTSESDMEQSALVQFELKTMTQAMSNFEVVAIFEPSCVQFLTYELKYGDDPVTNIKCKVTNQQVLSDIRDSSRRRLDDPTSLLVDINITGHTTSDAALDDMINDAYAEKSELFINVVKSKAASADIGTFDELHSLTSVEQMNEKSAISSGSGSIQAESNTASLIVIITGVGLIAIFVAGFAVSKMRNGTRKSAAASLGIPENITASPKKDTAGPFDFDLRLLKTLSEETKSYLPEALGGVVPKVRREIVAPRGKLGIITEDCEKGVVVHTVKEDSPLEGLMFPGDLIEGLDNMDVSQMSSAPLTKLMVSRSHHERKITVLSERLHTNYSD